MMDEWIKVSSFSKERKRILIQEHSIEFDNKKLDLTKVSELKYGLEPIQVDMFTVGRKFVLELKNPEQQFSIVLKSYFGFSRNYFAQLFTQIINEIWKSTGVRLIDEAIAKVKAGEVIIVGNCSITKEGITFKKNFVSWENLSYQKNYDRITLTDKSNYKIWTNLYYLETYNSDVLIAILDWIFKNDGINEVKVLSDKVISND